METSIVYFCKFFSFFNLLYKSRSCYVGVNLFMRVCFWPWTFSIQLKCLQRCIMHNSNVSGFNQKCLWGKSFSI